MVRTILSEPFFYKILRRKGEKMDEIGNSFDVLITEDATIFGVTSFCFYQYSDPATVN